MKNKLCIWLSILVMIVFAIAPAITGCNTPAGSSGSIPQEGIKVHGHWTVEVRNPDGTLAQYREFENALSATGGWQLADVLSRQKSVGGWLIHSGNTNSSESPFMEPPSSGLDCWIAESTYSTTQPWVFNNLTVSAPTSGPNAHKVVLSGTATAQRDGNINEVTTAVWTLDSSSPPSATYSGGGLDFTSTTITPVSVTAGQQIIFTVVISFS